MAKKILYVRSFNNSLIFSSPTNFFSTVPDIEQYLFIDKNHSRHGYYGYSPKVKAWLHAIGRKTLLLKGNVGQLFVAIYIDRQKVNIWVHRFDSTNSQFKATGSAPTGPKIEQQAFLSSSPSNIVAFARGRKNRQRDLEDQSSTGIISGCAIDKRVRTKLNNTIPPGIS